MNLDYIYEFVQLAQVKNYSDVADSLFISQSSLSKHILALEKELGCKLFDRSTRRISLTEDGERFLTSAIPLANNYISFRSDWYQDEVRMKQTIRVGTIPVTYPYGISEAINSFSAAHPDIVIRNKIDETSNIKEPLIDGRYDITFSRELTTELNGFACVPLAEDDFVLVINKKNPLSKRKSIDLKEIANEPIIMWQHGSKLFDVCFEACLAAHFVPREVAYTNKSINIIYMVKKNYGIGFMLRKLTTLLNDEDLAFVPLTESVRTYICMCYIPGQERSDAIRSFINYMKNYKL